VAMGSTVSDDYNDSRERDIERAQGFLKPRLDFAERIYSQAMNSLWLGNAGAALATLSFIGAAMKDGKFPKVLVLPLGFFLAGLIAMGIGTLIALVRVRGVITRNQRNESIGDTIVSDVQSPAERVGLSGRDWRTIMALCSGALFVAGCIVGFALLACQ
jgi:hypothetical protein